ncbi:tetratricopeptide repeat protein [Streptomyces sp. NPDC000594]|uniref:tetratricopeptide repeat protein n=1 Tax=Streptomyces sp. NPDC000594 TaxID=3154261 RepID=UPI0033233E61
MTSRPPAGHFGRRLRELRTEAGLSQEELANASGVTSRTVADLERGRTRGPQRRTVQALATALGLDRTTARNLEQMALLGRPRKRRAPFEPPNTLALPRDLGDFTARDPELARLRALVERPDATHPPIVVIVGQPGLGKTSFAVHAAHRLREHFPDGCFALDLHAMGPEPLTAAEALTRLLRALGVCDEAIPVATDDRSGLLRSLTEHRRLLLLLDNAADEAQIRPLLPSAGASLTLITSRCALAGLESVDRVRLPLLRREEGVTLLRRILGGRRVDREAQAARTLVDLCGHLPLAVRIAGQRIASRPDEHLGTLVAQLSPPERRLDTLHSGDLRVRAAFALSYGNLSTPARTLLRRSSLAAGPDFSVEAAALLAGLTVGRAVRYADELIDAGLLYAVPGTGRYRFHDLIKLFAAERTAAEDGPEVRGSALDGTADWMLARATAAARHFDAEHHSTPAGDPDSATAPTGRDRAREWLEAERDQWLASLRHAHTTGRHRQVVDAAEAMHWFSDLAPHWHQWADVFQCAVDAARTLGSPREEATHLNYLAWAHNVCTHQHHAALEAADAALSTALACGDRLQTGWALGYGAGALRRLGRMDEAIARLRAWATCHRDNPTPYGGRLTELTILNTLGEALRQHGRADEALAHHLDCLTICRQNDPGLPPHLLALYQAVALRNIGSDYMTLGRWQEAEAPLRQALIAFEALDSPAHSGPVQLELGRLLRYLDRPGEARTVLAAALRTLTAHHHPRQTEAAAELCYLDRARH